MSPFGDGLKMPCKADTGKAFKEAFGTALRPTGEAECSTTLGIEPGIAPGTALRITVGGRLGRGLESGLIAAPAYAIVTVLITVRGRKLEASLVTGLGTIFWTALATKLGIESGINFCTIFGRTLGTELGLESGVNFWTTSGRRLGRELAIELGVNF
jgi:hypothetical protein